MASYTLGSGFVTAGKNTNDYVKCDYCQQRSTCKYASLKLARSKCGYSYKHVGDDLYYDTCPWCNENFVSRQEDCAHLWTPDAPPIEDDEPKGKGKLGGGGSAPTGAAGRGAGGGLKGKAPTGAGAARDAQSDVPNPNDIPRGSAEALAPATEI